MFDRRFMQAVLAAILVLSARSAFARKEGVSLDYLAPGQCPDRARFEREVVARTSKAKFSPDGGRSFRIRLHKQASEWSGTLSIREGSAQPTERTMRGAACNEVVSALALVAALAIDPEASTAPPSELAMPPAPEPTPEPQPKPEPKPKPKPNPKPKPKPQPKPVTAPRISEAPPPEKPVQAPPAPGTLVRFGLAADLVSGPAPKPLAAAGAEVFLERPTLLGRSSVGIGFFGAETGLVGPDVASARFRWLAARLSLCPLGNAQPLYFRLCAASDIGALRGQGRQIAVSETHTRFWADAGIQGLVGYDLGSHFGVVLEGGALANLTRDRFLFQAPPRPVSVYDVPLASLFAGIGVQARIP